MKTILHPLLIPRETFMFCVSKNVLAYLTSFQLKSCVNRRSCCCYLSNAWIRKPFAKALEFYFSVAFRINNVRCSCARGNKSESINLPIDHFHNYLLLWIKQNEKKLLWKSLLNELKWTRMSSRTLSWENICSFINSDVRLFWYFLEKKHLLVCYTLSLIFKWQVQNEPNKCL